MSTNTLLKTVLMGLILATALSPARAAIINNPSGDLNLNIIDDPGNPSDGLRYLDLSITDGNDLSDATTNATALYANARLALPSELDDLYAAAGVTFPTTKPSDAWAAGGPPIITISDVVGYTTDVFTALGSTTGGPEYLIWTDPDGSSSSASTRDLFADLSGSLVVQHAFSTPPNADVGWLFVSEPASVVPLPGGLMLGVIGLASGSAALRRRRHAV